MIAGLLMFGLVAYQLWGTGVEYSRNQDRLENEFQALLAEYGVTTTAAAGAATTAPAPTIAAAGAATTAPAPTIADAVPTVPLTEAGGPVGIIRIPKVGLVSAIVEGVSLEDLKSGPGHYPLTPMPGQLGNASIAGHRTTYGQPFFRLDELQPGDEIVIETLSGTWLYRVTGSEVVDPGQTDVIATVDADVANLTLTTCDPRYSASRRLIVHATLDMTASPPPAASIPVDQTAATADTLAGEPGAGPASSASTGPTDTSGPSRAQVTDESEDAFTHGWFSDSGAWPQVMLWGLALVGIWLGAYRIARAARATWVGFAVGVVPFLIVAYFWYENVNRLLPAAL